MISNKQSFDIRCSLRNLLSVFTLVRKLLVSNIYLLTSLALIPITAQTQDLDTYINKALEQNPSLQSKHKMFEAAMERVTQAKTLEDPRISVGAFVSAVETRVGPQVARISLSQMFPWFGTLKEKGNVNTHLAEATYSNYLDARNALIADVEKVYFELYERKELQEVQLDKLEYLQSLKDIAQANFENDKGSLADVIRIDTRIKSVNTQINVLKEKEQWLKARFNNLLNEEPSTDIALPDLLLFTSNNSASFEGVVANNPKLKGVDSKIDAMKAQEQLARKQGYPNLGFGLDYVIISKRQDDMGLSSPPEGNGKDAIMPMVSLSLPIFRKKYKSAQKEAQLMQEAYSNEKEATVNELNSRYEQLQFSIIAEQQLVELYKQQVEDTKQAYELTLSAYANNGRRFDDLLSIQQQLFDFETDLIVSTVKLKKLESDLNYLLADQSID